MAASVTTEVASHSFIRERRKAPSTSKTAALRWAEARERVLLVQGKPKPVRHEEVQQKPTLEEFAGRFRDLDAAAARLRGLMGSKTGSVAGSPADSGITPNHVTRQSSAS